MKAYLTWHLVDAIAPYAGAAAYAEYFQFNGVELAGIVKPEERWKRCASSTSAALGEAVGQAFVAKYFPPRAKERIVELITNLHAAFLSDLKTLAWLDDDTRIAALCKLEAMVRNVGYPDVWRKYDDLPIGTSYAENVRAVAKFGKRRSLNKIGQPTDRSEWHMSPQTVNAYYSPLVNSINFSAGILQSPYFSEEAKDASNYGAIGMIIGHEMTHGFDTSGSQFDADRALNDWWTPKVKETFRSKAQCLEKQYGRFEALPGVFVNGRLTVTENIADQGGLHLAYKAYRISRAGKDEEAPIAGPTANQQYFVAMAQGWCSKSTDAALRKQTLGDPHSPARFRVLGAMQNNLDFAAAFNCPVGSPMAPAERCEIWQ